MAQVKNNTPPRLTFFCELNGSDLSDLFDRPKVIHSLSRLDASVSLGIIDHSTERANVVKSLNQAGIPVIAWQLLPRSEGYWYHMGNAPEAAAGYEAFTRWSEKHGLQWSGIGLDIEPDIHEFQHLLINKRQLIRAIFKRGCSRKKLIAARNRYLELVTRMRSDGYRVDAYEFPFMQDERDMGTTLLQRLTGIVDLPVDRRVAMLYSSFFRPYGTAILWDYARRSQSVGVGITGGGVEMQGLSHKKALNWSEFSHDLLLTRQWVDDIHIFSLEGCIEQGFLDRLIELDWAQTAGPPPQWRKIVAVVRKLLRSGLWLSAHPVLLTAIIVLAVCSVAG
ncbi:MAG: hypothetical protein GY703_03140 [Gammaproteobacteria bacterium]|nr:hypothetical protein [Gammaproteobacteria bacterium]